MGQVLINWFLQLRDLKAIQHFSADKMMIFKQMKISHDRMFVNYRWNILNVSHKLNNNNHFD